MEGHSRLRRCFAKTGRGKGQCLGHNDSSEDVVGEDETKVRLCT